MINITDEYIDRVQQILLRQGDNFDEERRTVIKCIESKDVQACPGSGKTTALLAKLLIISSQLPLEGNKGICVLTHTNVAIDEIRSKMELSSEDYLDILTILGQFNPLLINFWRYLLTYIYFIEGQLSLIMIGTMFVSKTYVNS